MVLATYDQRHRAELTASGCCVRCRQPVENNRHTLCNTCLEKGRRAGRQRYAKLKARGTCIDCDQPIGKASCVRCNTCHEKRNAGEAAAIQRERAYKRYTTRKAAGLCGKCGNPLDNGKATCHRCRHKAQEKRRQRRKEKRCILCGITLRVTVKSTMCEICCLKEAAKRWLGSATRWRKLQSLLIKQDYRCYYTQQQLVVGENAEIDHITPRSKEGSCSDPNNLQWVTHSVNCMKHNLTHNEFIALAQRIANVAKKRRTR